MTFAPARSQQPPLTLPPVLREFCRNIILITAISMLYCVFMRLVLHRHYPYDWPFFVPGARFSDFTIYQDKFRYFHQPAFFTTGFPFTYPAPYALLFELFYKFGGHYALACFFTFFGLAFILPAVLFQRALVARGLSQAAAWVLTGTALLLSWPVLLMIDRASTEVFVWVPLCIGAWAYARGKEWTFAVLVGIAAALKYFPILYLVLFLSRRGLPKLLVGVLTCAVTVLVALAILGPSIAVANHGIETAMSFWQKLYMSSYMREETGLDHTVLAAAKVFLAAVFHVRSNGLGLQRLAHAYLPAMAIVGVLLYFLRIRIMPRLNQFMALSIISIYFTPFSGDGTLIYLYFGFALCCFLVLDAWKRNIRVPGLHALFLCFAYLFAITSFIVVSDHRFEGQAKCLVLGLLLYLVLRYPLGRPLKSGAVAQELALPNSTEIAHDTEMYLGDTGPRYR